MPPHVQRVAAGDVYQASLKNQDPDYYPMMTGQSTGLIHVWIPVGGMVDVVANGHDLGKLGDRKSPFEWSFKPQDFRGTPSPNGP